MNRIEMSTVGDGIATMLQITLSFVVVKSQCLLGRLRFSTLGLCLPQQPSFNAHGPEPANMYIPVTLL